MIAPDPLPEIEGREEADRNENASTKTLTLLKTPLFSLNISLILNSNGLI
jgi:hypothetical protein